MNQFLPNALLIMDREYRVRVNSRAFVIGTVLLAVLLAAGMLAPAVIGAIARDDPDRVAIYSGAQLDQDPIQAIQGVFLGGAAGNVSVFGAPEAQIVGVDDLRQAEAQVARGELHGLLTIDRRSDGTLAFRYVSADDATDPTRLLIQQGASALTIADRLSAAGLDPGQQAGVFRPPSFEAIELGGDGSGSNIYEAGGVGVVVVAIGLIVLAFVAIVTYGSWIAQSVAEEKSSRVMELLVTAATPFQLLAGKVLGTSLAALTQFAVVIAAATAGYVASGPLVQILGGNASPIFSLPSLSVVDVGLFALFFITAFLLYAVLFAGVGSLVSRQEDLQQALTPVMWLAVAGYGVSWVATSSLDSEWVRIISQVPFFSPFIMPIRILVGNAAAWEVGLSLVLLLGGTFVALWLAARLYRAGVLSYGQRPGIRQLWHAAREHT
ncbi:MAG: hypothetical protein GEU73_05800 [Chloroflexi bacterium]|nr:hypothetical protein [Chloroflexota bacterium]